MQISIIGLNQSGKTTLFRALSGKGKTTEGIAIVKVPDERINRLSEIFNPKKTTYATIEFKDAKIELDNSGAFTSKTIGEIRNADALCIMVRSFKNDTVPHPKGSINPLRDFKEIEEELIITDLLQIEKRLNRLNREAKQKSTEYKILEKLKRFLDDESPLNQAEITDGDKKLVSGFKFLTLKPFIVIINSDENNSIDDNPLINYLKNRSYEYLKIYAKIEEEISQLPIEDQRVFMEDIGIKESIIDRLIKKSYEVVNLISFLTAGEDEVRAWTIKKGSTAVEAAKKIHSDIARGFIRAEVVHYEDFIREGSFKACKGKGFLRLEGKDYIVKDGDIINYRFNV